MRIELDKKSLFALASDTRLEILKSLQPMRRTVSQLSEELKIDKAAVYRHLKKLESGGLVKRHEDHGFVYYGLSWKSRDLMSPNENTKIVILISISWILLCGSVFLVILGYYAGPFEGLSGTDGSNEEFPSDELIYDPSTGDRLPSDQENSWIWWLIPVGCFAGGAVFTLFIANTIFHKPLQKTASAEENAQ